MTYCACKKQPTTPKCRSCGNGKFYRSLNALVWRALADDKLTDFQIAREHLGAPWTASAKGLAPTREFPEGERFVGMGNTAQEAALEMLAKAEAANLRIGSRL